MSILPIALGLMELVPSFSKIFHNEKTQTLTKKVVDVAQKIANTSDVEKATSIIKQDPKLFLQFQQEILKLEQQIDLNVYKDRQDARARDVAIAQTGRKNRRADIMVVCAAVGLMVCLFSLCLFDGNLPGEAVGIISTIAGIFGACLKDAYAFEFGSSRGSKEKDLQMASVLLSAK